MLSSKSVLILRSDLLSFPPLSPSLPPPSSLLMHTLHSPFHLFPHILQQTKPHSFQVLLTLPQRQLENVLEQCPAIRPPLITHVQNLTPYQVSCGSLSLATVSWLPGSSFFGAHNHKKVFKVIHDYLGSSLDPFQSFWY